MNKLKLKPLDDIHGLEQPLDYVNLNLDSPALEFLTDFTVVKPLIIDSDCTALETKKMMMKAHVRLKLVLDPQGDFIGMVSADDLSDRKITQKVAEGEKREEISITDCMLPKHKLSALDFHQLKHSNILDVINVLKDSGQQHCLVVDGETKTIRGIFSVSDISRKLHLSLDIQDQPSFSKIASTLD